MRSADTLIIGSGLAGLHFAHLLKEKNKSALILEKSAGIGGRMATRRINDVRFDHGLAFLPNDPLFVKFFEKYQLKGYMKVCEKGLYVNGGMTSIARVIANGLELELNQKVTEIKRESTMWLVNTEQGETFLAKRVVLTAPYPEALELIKKNDITPDHQLPSIPYTKALTLILTAKGFSEGLTEGTFKDHTYTPMKTRGLHPEGLIFHASPTFSEKHFLDPEKLILQSLLKEVEEAFGKLTVSHVELNRWRYVQPVTCLPKPFEEVDKNLFMIGDAFKHPGIKGSLLSAEALATHLS